MAERKLKRKIVEEIRKEKQFEEEQSRLKEKYDMDQKENVVIVETSNMYKFTVKAVSSFVRLVATILLLILATIGLMTLLYPGIRAEFFVVMNKILMQLKGFLPFM